MNQNQIESARQTYVAVLRAVNAAARWHTEEAAKTEGEYTQTVQSADAARIQTEQSATRTRTDGVNRANDLRTRVEENVKRGELLFNNSNLGKQHPQSLPPARVFVPAPLPEHALARAADLTEQLSKTLQSKLGEYERSHDENLRTIKYLVIGGVVVMGILIVIIMIVLLGS